MCKSDIEKVITYIFFTDFDDTLGNLGEGMFSYKVGKREGRKAVSDQTDTIIDRFNMAELE